MLHSPSLRRADFLSSPLPLEHGNRWWETGCPVLHALRERHSLTIMLFLLDKHTLQAFQPQLPPSHAICVGSALLFLHLWT